MKTLNNTLLYILLFVLTLFSTQVFAQTTVSANRVVASQELWIRTLKFDSISNDPNFIGNRITVVPTQQAVKAYVDNKFTNAKYQIVQSSGTPVTQRSALNFNTQFTIVDNSGNNSSDISLNNNLVIVTSLRVPTINGSTTARGVLNIVPSTNAIKGNIIFGSSGLDRYDDSSASFYIGSGTMRIWSPAANTTTIAAGPSAFADNITFGPSNRIFINSVLGIRDYIESTTPTLSIHGGYPNTGTNNSIVLYTGNGGIFQGAGTVVQNAVYLYTPGTVQITGPGATFNSLMIQPAYNMVSGSADTVRGIYYNPIITSMTGVVVHDAWRSTSGNISIGGSGHILLGGIDSGANINIRAGTASVAPIKLTAGVLLTVPVNGTIEFDGTYYYSSAGGIRSPLGGLPLPGANGSILKVVGGIWTSVLDSTYMRNGISVSATGDTIKLGGQLNQTTNLHGQFDFVFDSLTSFSLAHNSLANKTPVVTDSTLIRDAAGRIWTTPHPIPGRTTLIAGTKTVTITGISSTSNAQVTVITPSGVASTVQYQAVCSSNTLTIQANVAAGTINTSDVSVVSYVVYP